MLVKLAKIEKISKKNVVMINKDGGEQFLDFMEGHSCYEEGHRAHGESPHKGKPCSEALFGLKSTECADFQVKF